jgi:putative ABC transport system permease protein
VTIWRRLKYLIPSYRRREEREMQHELESLRAMAEHNELGNLTLAAENARAVWGWNSIDSLGQDLRYAFRTLLRHPRVTGVALLSLAFGIGVNTLVFTVVNAMMFRPMPYPEPERLVKIGSLSRANCTYIRENIDVFEHFGCYTDATSGSFADLDSADPTSERVFGLRLTAGAAQALNVQPILGRWFNAAEEREGADRVLLMSFSLWHRRFFDSPDVLGRVIRFDGEPTTIIGVMPEEFEFVALNGDFWVPIRSSASDAQTTASNLGAIARLKSGATVAAAQAAMSAVDALDAKGGSAVQGRRIELRSIEKADVNPLADSGQSLLVLQGAVTFVLLIACANVAGLLLAQGTTQQKEMAVRTALGSGRWRIFRQLLVHGALLSGFGGTLGVVLGFWGVRVLTNALPAGLPRPVYSMHLDARVLALAIALCAICALLVGIAPALKSSHADPLDAMRDAGRSATAGVSRQKLRSGFVAGQIALAFILLVSAGLMINSLYRLARAPLGFDPEDLVTIQIELPDAKFRQPSKIVLASGALEMNIHPQIYRTTEDIRERLTTIPGVTAASGIAIFAPLSGSLNLPVRVDSAMPNAPDRAQFLPVLPDYFKTLQVRVIAGREFNSGDRLGTMPVAVINQAMAQRFWPSGSAMGKQVQVDTLLLPNQPVREIVGIVDEIMQYAGQEARPQLYLPYAQLSPQHDERLSNELRHLTFVARTSQPVAQITPAIRSAVAAVDAGQAISSIETMRDTAYHSLQRRRVYFGMLGSFAVIAVFLAVIGVYGVMAQVVSQRTNEIGIRMALGADHRQVRGLIVRRGAWLIGIGLVAGVFGALAITRVIRSALFGVAPTDPYTFLAAAAILGSIALLACYVPARRASRVDPMLALRHD